MKGNKIIVVLALMTIFIGCQQKIERTKTEISFWGDSTAVFIAKEQQNGYDISIIFNKELCLIHFERGDSISRYCALHRLPDDLECYSDSVGVFSVDLKFPVLEVDTLKWADDIPDFFFMDVNFDGEEDFVVEHHGYNRAYYACFDLVNGNYKGSCPGLLECLFEEPYNNIVASQYAGGKYTVFDRENKEIFIHERLGINCWMETWAKYMEDDFRGTAVKVVKKEESELVRVGEDFHNHVITYMLVDDTLKKVRDEIFK